MGETILFAYSPFNLIVMFYRKRSTAESRLNQLRDYGAGHCNAAPVTETLSYGRKRANLGHGPSVNIRDRGKIL